MNSTAFPATVLTGFIRLQLARRPLWKAATVQDCLDKSAIAVKKLIENGELPWVFDISARHRRALEPRILAYSVMELAGGKGELGASRNFNLPQVIDLILPKRDVRGVELQRLFSASPDLISDLFRAKAFKMTGKPTAQQGPNASPRFGRASVASFLEQRRML
jgi:hypothetical protein